jgi:hypothetical protein
VHADELAKLDEELLKPKKQDLTKYNALLIIRQGWDTKNASLDAQIDAIKDC